MNSQEFVEIVKSVVRDAAINDVISVIENPPGRRPLQELKDKSDWYNSLQDDQKQIVKSIVSQAVDSALFGFLCVIDGVRAFESMSNSGRLELIYT